MDEYVRLNDGTTLHPASAITSDGILWLYIDRITLREAFNLLDDPERTAVIESDSFDTPGKVVGFTDLFSLRRESNDMITAGLRKGALG